MVTIKFIGETTLRSKGITFENNGIYKVKDEVAEYLSKTFRNIEILDETPKPKVPEAPKPKPEGK
jgi:hypothetical protein